MPFTCTDTWTGTSRASHSPSSLSIDWNKDGDLGSPMIAAAPGVVTRVADLGNASYGRYIIVDHGDGRTSLYAHLMSLWTTVGASVDQGTLLGRVGSTGGSTGPHLHYEERLNGTDHQSYFHRTAFVMGSTLSSQNCPDFPIAGGDFVGEGHDRPALFRRSAVGDFILRRPGAAALRVDYGRPTDQPVVGDWNGDGVTDIGIRRPARTGSRCASDGPPPAQLGRVVDVPVAGDWDGNGRSEVGVWSRNPGFPLRAATARSPRRRRSPGDRPVTGDWNGDGRTDLGVFDPATAYLPAAHPPPPGGVARRPVPFGVSDRPPGHRRLGRRRHHRRRRLAPLHPDLPPPHHAPTPVRARRCARPGWAPSAADPAGGGPCGPGHPA